MAANNELRTNRLIGTVDDGKDVVTAFADVEAALRTILGVPADTAMSQAMTITSAGNITMTGTLTAAGVPTTDLMAATRGYVTAQAAGGSFGAQRAIAVPLSNIVITGNVRTYIEWDHAPIDTGEFWSAGNPTRFTIPADGEYMVGINAYCNLPLGLWFDVWVNRTTQRIVAYKELDGVSYVGVSVGTYLTPLIAGDFVEFMCHPRTYGITTIYSAYTMAWIVRVA